MNVCIYGASSNAIDKVFLDTAYSLSASLAKHGHTLVFGGGANGVMGATVRGAADNGGKTIGIAPKFFTVDGVLYDNCSEFIYTETMRERKQLLEEKSDAFIIAAGGIGTMDEFFEILTLKQLEQHNKAIVIYNVNGFYDDLLSMLQKTADKHFMKQKSLELYRVFDNEDDIINYIENYNPQDFDIRELKEIG